MKYFYEKPELYTISSGITYRCNNIIYNYCTLYLQGDYGLAVIQQHFDQRTKLIRWAELDPWLVDDIYNNEGFSLYFKDHSAISYDGQYPTVTVRKLMWALKMKPLRKEIWEDSQKIQFT